MPAGPRRYYPKRFYVFVYATKRGRLVASISGDPAWRVRSINEGRGGGAELTPADLPVTLLARTSEQMSVKIARAQANEIEKTGQKGLKKWAREHAYATPKEGSKLST